MVTFLKDACFPVTSKGWIASLDSFFNFRLLDPSGELGRASTMAVSETGCADVNELSSFGVTSIESSAAAIVFSSSLLLQLVLNLVATKTEMNGYDKPNVLGELYGVVRFQHVREVLLELNNTFLRDGKFVLDARLDTFSFPFGENAVEHFVAASELFVSVDVERPTDDSQVSLQRSPCW